GAELAASAIALGSEVTVVEAAAVPLGRGLPPALGELYGHLHRGRGVDLRLNCAVREVVDTSSGLLTRTTDGAVQLSDAVVVAIGSAPQLALAIGGGLAVAAGPPGGVLVDQYCRTSGADVYAAGDIANHPNPILGQRLRVEHWQNAQHQSAVAAHNMMA